MVVECKQFLCSDGNNREISLLWLLNLNESEPHFANTTTYC